MTKQQLAKKNIKLIWAAAILLIVAMVVYIFIVVAAQRIEHASLYMPTQAVHSDISSYHLTDVFLDTQQGDRIHAVEKVKPQAKYIVLFFHGNAGNITSDTEFIELFDQSEYSYILTDYPGYGQSQGEPSEQALYATADAIYNHAISDLNYSANQIIISGMSLGGAVAIDLAARVDEAVLVVFCSFMSTHDMARSLYPRLLAMPGLFLSNKYESIEKIGSIDAPVLFIHGDQDSVIPLEHGRELYNSAKETKNFYLAQGGQHWDLVEMVGTDKLTQLIEDLLTNN